MGMCMKINGMARDRITRADEEPKKLSGKRRFRNIGTIMEMVIKTNSPVQKPIIKEWLKSFLVFNESLACSENTGYRIVPKATGIIVAASRNLNARL